jgi:endonuclease/exonuclease/phosphatase (EEP) superfamily protein YafD
MPFDRPTIQRVLASRFVWATYVLAIATAASFAGRLHWTCDLATHFRAQYAAGGLLLAFGLIACRHFRASLAPLALGLVNVWFLVPFYLQHDEPGAMPPPEAARLKIVSLNVYAGSKSYDEVLGYLREAQPDFVLFTEMTHAWQKQLQPLEAEYPEQHFAPRDGAFGIALIAKPKLSDVRIDLLGGQNYVRATCEIDGRPLTLFGVHPFPPMGARASTMRNDSFAALNKHLRETKGPVITVGDFNSTSWSPYFADLLEGTRLRDSRLGRGIQPSWSTTHPLPLRIPIDHMLVSPEVHIFERRLGPAVGSDHLPVEMEFSLRP